MGTTFTVCLPKSGDQLSIPHEIPDKEARSLASPLRILVMDDEESILETTGLMLDALGFESSFAKEGAEALEIFRKAADNGKPFDIVIIDLTIPGGMGGEEANRLILELNPDARTIVSSGYSDSSLMANYRNHGFSGILPKPYRIEDLEKTINASLSSAR